MNHKDFATAVAAAIALALGIWFFADLFIDDATAKKEKDKVTICHAATDHYQRIVVDDDAIGGHFTNPGTPKAGHEDDLLFEGEVKCPAWPTPTPTSTPTPTPSVVPTPTPSSTPEPSSSPSPSVSPSQSPSPSATPSESPTPTPTPSITTTPSPSATPTPPVVCDNEDCYPTPTPTERPRSGGSSGGSYAKCSSGWLTYVYPNDPACSTPTPTPTPWVCYAEGVVVTCGAPVEVGGGK